MKKILSALFLIFTAFSMNAQCFSQPCPGDACQDASYLLGPTDLNPVVCHDPVVNGCWSGAIWYWYCSDEDGTSATFYNSTDSVPCWSFERDYWIEVELTDSIGDYTFSVTSTYSSSPNAPNPGGIQLALWNECPMDVPDCTPCGDIDSDGWVTVTDLNTVVGYFGVDDCDECGGADISCPPDGNVNVEDLNIVLGQFGSECTNAAPVVTPIANSPCSWEVSGPNTFDPTDDWYITDWTFTVEDLPAGTYLIQVDGWGISGGESTVCVSKGTTAAAPSHIDGKFQIFVTSKGQWYLKRGDTYYDYWKMMINNMLIEVEVND